MKIEIGTTNQVLYDLCLQILIDMNPLFYTLYLYSKYRFLGILFSINKKKINLIETIRLFFETF